MKKELRDVKRWENRQMKRETGSDITIAVLDIKRYCLSFDVCNKMFVDAVDRCSYHKVCADAAP